MNMRWTIHLVCVLSVAASAQNTWVATASNAPTARESAGMAYDEVRERTVLYGGRANAVTFAETWEWDGAAWSYRLVAHHPPPGIAQLAYDRVRQVTVLTTLGTWEWDGIDWTQRSTESHAAPVFHPPSGQVVAFSTSAGPMWRWDGASWTSAPGPAHPVTNAAYDAQRGRVVAIGNEPQFVFPGPIRVSEWDGGSWTEIPLSPPLPGARGVAFAFDGRLGKCVLFGGDPGGFSASALSQTFAWEGTYWSVPTTTSPTRRAPALAWHASHGQFLAFGGFETTYTTIEPTFWPPYWTSVTQNIYSSETYRLVTCGAGQANSPAARLELGARATGTCAGPFAASFVAGTPVVLEWSGPSGAPYVLAMGPLNLARIPFGCGGILDIGTPPAWSDVSILLNGLADPAWTLDANGRATIPVALPVLPSGHVVDLQGAVFQPSGAPCPIVLTAAWSIFIL